MRHTCITVVLTLGLISMSGRVLAQSNTTPWPGNPPVGIGTQPDGGPLNALQIHYDPSNPATLQAIIRLSEGSNTGDSDYGMLGLMPTPGAHPDTMFSSLSRGNDLILHDHQDGDIIITNFTTPRVAREYGTAIRFATTGDTLARPFPSPGHHDLERLTIMGNGNIGIDLPPSSTGLNSALEQVQIGGSSVPPPGYTTPVPGLTIYGGNRFEGMPAPFGDTGFYPYSYRTIHFNTYGNHLTGVGSRIAPLSSSGIDFSDIGGGLLNFNCWPYDSTRGLNDFTHELTMQVNGNGGMFLWYYQDSTHPYHHIFDFFLPGVITWPVTRNTNGLTFFHTPVCISSDTTSAPSCDLQNLPVHPDMGDGMTWLLTVDGPGLMKELYVDDSDWPDYVFLPGYHLTPLGEVKNFMETNHHLPDIPPATQMTKSGIPVGRTEAAITKQLEEAMLYITKLNDDVKELKTEVDELKNQKDK